MGYGRLWVISGMAYHGFNCRWYADSLIKFRPHFGEIDRPIQRGSITPRRRRQLSAAWLLLLYS